MESSAPPAQPLKQELASLGDLLTRKDGGLDCRSCHGVGRELPTGDDKTKVAPGINFAHTRERMRGEFFHRFVLDPPRYEVTTRMPKLSADGRTTAATSILGGDAPQQVGRHVAMAFLTSPVTGVLRGYPLLERVRNLESLHEIHVGVQPGQRLPLTVDDTTEPMMVVLAHPRPEVVERDLATVGWLDGHGFYDVEPEPAGESA